MKIIQNNDVAYISSLKNEKSETLSEKNDVNQTCTFKLVWFAGEGNWQIVTVGTLAQCVRFLGAKF